MSRTNKYLIIVIALICLAVIITFGLQANASELVEVVKSFDTSRGELPEGITIDKSGNIYVTLGPPFFVGGGLGEVWKISPEGTEMLLAEFDFPGVSGPAGLAVDAPGNVYFAFPTMDPETHGVYQLTGSHPIRVPGTENILLPNGLAFDKQGNLYVSDTFMGALWRIPHGGSGPPEVWIQHTTLGGCEDDPFGANGVAYWKGSLYVANTTRGLLVNIPILNDGSSGEPEIVAGIDDCDPEFDDLDAMDGIALDVKGNVYALLVMQNKFVRIDPIDGSYTTLLTGKDGLWNPASIAFGTGNKDRKSVFITNFAVLPPEPTNSLGPAVLKFDVGTPGLPLP
jgi:sugar lactone lactonase YvrE